MKEKISVITKTYIGEQTLDGFAKSLGIGASKQLVWNWKEGKEAPDTMTLFRVIASPDSTALAKTWAGEILAIYQTKTEDPIIEQN